MEKESFGARVLRLRKARGWGRERLAIEAGLSVTYIRDIERGKTHRPSMDTLVKLAGAFGATPDYLRDGSTPGMGLNTNGSLERILSLEEAARVFAAKLGMTEQEMAARFRTVDEMSVAERTNFFRIVDAALAAHHDPEEASS